jgi:UDP-2-acetamido-3-amino-2,3-dideoxy-glucuronate N-acetyltransferase
VPDPFFKHPLALVETDQVGEKTNVWAYAHVMKGAVVGSHCNIGDHAFVESGAVVGNEVTIKNGVAVWQYVTVEDRVFLGPNCSLTNDMRPRSKRDWSPVSTTIGYGATVGANATIVCGCHIGRHAFIGAGAVVTKPVPDYAVVFGNPGRVHGYVCECCHPLKGRGPKLTCATCGLSYVKTKAGIVRDAVGQASSPVTNSVGQASSPVKNSVGQSSSPVGPKKRGATASARARVAQRSRPAKTRRT